jgi:hypothetical protein
MTRRIVFALILFATLPLYAAAPDLNRLSFLLGTWNADGGAGSATFERALDSHVILRKSWAMIPSSGGKTAKHEDLMVIFPYGDHLRAAYYDSSGYVVGYEVTAPAKNTVVLTSDAMAGVNRARLTYTLGANGVLAAKVDIAPAGKPDAFAPSMAWNSRKK